jgi:hypothetical protein
MAVAASKLGLVATGCEDGSIRVYGIDSGVVRAQAVCIAGALSTCCNIRARFTLLKL